MKRLLLGAVGGAVGAGAATLAYSALYERTRWTLRRFDVPVLAQDAEPLRILHISDLHMLPGQHSKQEWVRSLDALDPDFVALTGDNLSSADAVPSVLDALGPLLRRPGAFVFGSNDYYGPVPKNPFKYFDKHHKRVHGPSLPWTDLRDALAESGWADLTNARATVTAGGRVLDLGGVDDPHLRLDRYVAGALPPADLHLGLVHAPEPRVLNSFAADGYDLVLAGHTHGGQLRVPGYGALVTNCGIERDLARGAHRWSGDTWLHVSAGMGTSPYAPIRFACPPEVSLLTLVPRPEHGGRDTRARESAGVG
ncbi:metallophosphoesterase [Cryptosporangium phraense]|uniref:Metallophosphoesterase n=1 Tax=Cryptosporangium phraense TaxID=2593070 RepID=A0A545AR40_9ACTN|nr:metallophosphoesterase [Cryptosporangium phraense]TQS43794.1 metallophosphoesterase [Cryptosporangium phraense]